LLLWTTFSCLLFFQHFPHVDMFYGVIPYCESQKITDRSIFELIMIFFLVQPWDLVTFCHRNGYYLLLFALLQL
jgi:hypothetical protein